MPREKRNTELDFDAQPRRWTRHILSFIAYAAIGAGLMALTMPVFLKSEQAAQTKSDKRGDVSIPVEAIRAERINMTDTLTVTATLEANESALIKSEVAGRITSIPFTEGSDVKKGDVLFKLDDSVQRATLAQAQANMSFADNNARRYNNLAQSRAISRSEAEQASADVKTARANIALAQANLNKMTIRAPFDGRAGIRSMSVGDVVDPGVSLVTIAQIKPLRILFELPEKYLNNVALDQPVRFSVTSKPNRIFEGIVTAIDSQIDPSTRAVKIKASVANEDGALLSGQFASLTFGLASDAKVIAIPDSALVPEGGQFFVYKVNKSSKVDKVNVQPGLRDGQNVEIKRGLNEGDLVVTAGQQKLFPESRVTVMPPAPITVMPSPEEDAAQ